MVNLECNLKLLFVCNSEVKTNEQMIAVSVPNYWSMPSFSSRGKDPQQVVKYL